MNQAVIIFVRNPQLGKVKTRLAATLGEEKALAIYKELLLHTKEITNQITADKYVFYFDKIEGNDLWNDEVFFKRLQSNDELGRKMENAFSELFDTGYDEVLIIGSDCLQLTTLIIEEAFILLNDNDVVIGPAKDGGYYLLGMKKLIGLVFKNKQWSTDTVFHKTINDLKADNFSFACLPVLTDVDTEEDWNFSKK